MTDPDDYRSTTDGHLYTLRGAYVGRLVQREDGWWVGVPDAGVGRIWNEDRDVVVRTLLRMHAQRLLGTEEL